MNDICKALNITYGPFRGLIFNGKLIANQLSQQPEAKQETPIGWVVHYVVSIAYAYVLFILVHFGILEHIRAIESH